MRKPTRAKRRAWRSRPIRGNCLSWALRQWRRRGGYLVIRRAYLTTPFWHFAWQRKEGAPIFHFRPMNDQVHLPWPYLKGFVSMHEDQKGP